eukprot:NP_001304918.1 uncharacterized protein LOC100132813 [Homo sapiens]
MGNFGGPSGIHSTRGPPAARSLGFALHICRPAGLKWVALDGVTEKSCDITERQNRESFPLATPPWPPGLKSAYSSPQLPRPRAAEIPLVPEPSQASASGPTQPLGSGI